MADLRRIMHIIPESLAGLRDRAILLLGFAGGMRRCGVVGMTVECLALTPEGLVVTIVRSKTDQNG